MRLSKTSRVIHDIYSRSGSRTAGFPPLSLPGLYFLFTLSSLMLKIVVAYREISQGAQVSLPVYPRAAVLQEDVYLGAICPNDT